MSDKDYKGKKGTDGNNYKPLSFYQNNISGVDNGFDTFNQNDEFYFTYNIDGQVVLISEGYASAKSRDNGVASADKNRLIENRFKRKTTESGNHFFDLIAGNHQEIASSAWFTSSDALDAAIHRLTGVSNVPLSAASIVGGAAVASSLASQASPTPPPITPAQATDAPVATAPVKAEASRPQAAGNIPPTQTAAQQNNCCSYGWLWWLMPLLIIMLAWYLLSRCCGDQALPSVAPNTPPATEEVASVAANTPKPTANTEKPIAPTLPATEVPALKPPTDKIPPPPTDGALGKLAAQQLPGGVALNIPEQGFESKLLAFITDDSLAVSKDKWMNFDRINFQTGKAELTLDSREQIANISAILRAYPNVELKIGGYTDNTGGLALNQKLSESRAKTVENALISQGVDQGRLASEGYGPQHPVATNDTAEGRAKNRRIALRVTQK